jgi:hypothetical protein
MIKERNKHLIRKNEVGCMGKNLFLLCHGFSRENYADIEIIILVNENICVKNANSQPKRTLVIYLNYFTSETEFIL